MQLVRIAGSTEEMRRLGDVEGLHFERSSASRLGDDTWQVAGYATDEALTGLRERGLEVELVVASEQLAQERETLFASITRDEDAPPAADAGASQDEPS